MRLRWLVNNFADPHIPLTSRQRRDTERFALELYCTRWFKLLLFGACGISLAMFIAFSASLKPVVAAVLGTSDTAALTVISVVVISGNWVLLVWLKGHLLTRPFRRALRDRGVRVCVGCGYLMDGITLPGVCPECSEQEPIVLEAE